MDNEIERRRAINYLTDLEAKLTLLQNGGAIVSYGELYQNYNEAKNYSSKFLTDNKELKNDIDGLPALIRPNIFNREPGAMWNLTILGLVNPFVTILFLTITFPLSIPYLIIRAIVIRKTKLKADQAKLGLTRIVNKLKEKG